MGGVRWVVVVVVVGVAACGRIGFGDDAPLDGPGDGATHDAPDLCSPAWDLCDSFETGVLPIWTVDPSMTRDTTVAHRGGASMHSMIPAINPNTEASSVMIENATLAGGAIPFWVRMWVRAHGLPVATNGLELAYAEQPSGAFGDYLFEHAATIDVYTQFTDTGNQLALTLPDDTWTCLVWSVVPAMTNGTISLDGDLGSVSVTGGTDGSVHIRPIAIGPHFSSTNVDVAQPPIEMWIDDVIVHHAQVTCTD
jgi:hypothetical protein